jgi:hypothetical protein
MTPGAPCLGQVAPSHSSFFQQNRTDHGRLTRELGRDFIGMIWPIRMDHAIFYKWLIKIIIRAFTLPQKHLSSRPRAVSIMIESLIVFLTHSLLHPPCSLMCIRH